MAVAGNDYCIVASSTRLSTGFSILSRDVSMVLKLCASDANLRPTTCSVVTWISVFGPCGTSIRCMLVSWRAQEAGDLG